MQEDDTPSTLTKEVREDWKAAGFDKTSNATAAGDDFAGWAPLCMHAFHVQPSAWKAAHSIISEEPDHMRRPKEDER